MQNSTYLKNDQALIDLAASTLNFKMKYEPPKAMAQTARYSEAFDGCPKCSKKNLALKELKSPFQFSLSLEKGKKSKAPDMQLLTDAETKFLFAPYTIRISQE